MVLLVVSLVLLAAAFLGAAVLAVRPHLPAQVRAAYARQLALQERYASRYEVSGREALAARQALRWRGDTLAGELLPPRR